MIAGWGYGETNGPDLWHENFPQASGSKQSPVDIKTANVSCENIFNTKLSWTYPEDFNKSLINTGYCWRVDINGSQSLLTGGPLKTNLYKIEQFHCHWGCEDNIGSEHTVDGRSYSGELHFVHWNSTKYKSSAEASLYCDGLAVLAVFLKVGQHNGELDKITSLLRLITHKNDRVTPPSCFDINKLIPEDNCFWTYDGSLTTPPCSESVTWILFKSPIEVSHFQIEAMRNLSCLDFKESTIDVMGKIKNNFRPVQPLGKRILREFGNH